MTFSFSFWQRLSTADAGELKSVNLNVAQILSVSAAILTLKIAISHDRKTELDQFFYLHG